MVIHGARVLGDLFEAFSWSRGILICNNEYILKDHILNSGADHLGKFMVRKLGSISLIHFRFLNFLCNHVIGAQALIKCLVL